MSSVAAKNQPAGFSFSAHRRLSKRHGLGIPAIDSSTRQSSRAHVWARLGPAGVCSIDRGGGDGATGAARAAGHECKAPRQSSARSGPDAVRVLAGRRDDHIERARALRVAAAVAPSKGGRADLLEFAHHVEGEALGPVENIGRALLAPCDLQAIKACGVTFAVSLLGFIVGSM